MSEPRTASLLRNRDFSLLLSGQVVSYLGNQVQLFALPLVVLSVTGSTVQAGLVMGLNTAAYLVFGLFAGALVDRWDRKRVMIWCDVGRGVLVGSVALALWTGHLGMPQLYAVSLVTGVLATFFQVSNTAALPNVVERSRLSTALGMNQSAFNVVRIGGASLAGALYGLGRLVPFLADAVSFLLSALSLRFIRANFQRTRDAGAAPVSARLRTEIRDGLLWLWRRPVIRFLTLVQAADSLRYGAGYLVIIILATEVGATPTEIGFIFSGAAIGAVIGAVLSDRVTKRFRLGAIAVTMLWVEALVFPLYALAPEWRTLAGVAALESVVAPIYMVAMTTYRLSTTPDALQGRVTSAANTLTTGAMSLGTMLGGALIAALGVHRVVLLSTAWLVLLALLTTVNRTVRASRGPVEDETPADVA